MQQALGTQATAVRSQSYYLDITPPGHDKGTFVAGDGEAARHSDRDAVATIGDMQNDLAMFAKQRHVVRHGQCHRRRQAAGDACHAPRTSDDGFAKAMEVILKPTLSSRTSELTVRPTHNHRACRRTRAATACCTMALWLWVAGCRPDDSCMRG